MGLFLPRAGTRSYPKWVYLPIMKRLLLMGLLVPALSQGQVLLVAGLDNRPGDLSAGSQARLLSEGLHGAKVDVVRYSDLAGARSWIRNHPRGTVVLFSAGCGWSAEVSVLVRDPARVWILEPWAKGQSTCRGVRAAVSMGVPVSHVVVGPNAGRGLGIVCAPARTPPGTGHLGSLRTLGRLIGR